MRLSWWDEDNGGAWVTLGMEALNVAHHVNNIAFLQLEAFQLSLLAGRIMIKDLRYHGSCQSFRAVKCNITWRYWMWRTREGYIEHSGESDMKGVFQALVDALFIYLYLTRNIEFSKHSHSYSRCPRRCGMAPIQSNCSLRGHSIQTAA